MQASNLEAPEYLNALGAAMLCCEDNLVHENEGGLTVNSGQPQSSSVT